MEWSYQDYVVTDDASAVDLDVVHSLLSTSYWAAGRSKEIIKTTVDNSACFSVLHHGQQVGFGRVVTDRAVFAWIADVIIHPDHMGKGLGTFLMECIDKHPDVPSSHQMLRTEDAHSFYERFGFRKGEVLAK